MATVQMFSAVVGNDGHEVVIEPPAQDGQKWRVDVDGVAHRVDAHRLPTGEWSLLTEDGRSWCVDIASGKNGTLRVTMGGNQLLVKIADAHRQKIVQAAHRSHAADGLEVLRAPMPGKIIRVLTQVGATIALGQGLVVVEAMKMENEICAPKSGVVKAIYVVENQAVEAQEALLEVA